MSEDYTIFNCPVSHIKFEWGPDSVIRWNAGHIINKGKHIMFKPGMVTGYEAIAFNSESLELIPVKSEDISPKKDLWYLCIRDGDKVHNALTNPEWYLERNKP